jgi:hypothetical protein
LRIVRRGGFDAGDDSVDDGAKVIQMIEALAPVDAMRASGRRRDSPFERSADLAHDE